MSTPSIPVIPAETHLPEITVRSVLLAILLTAVLAGANAYLGLFAGMTVSASIPAAVLSMAILRRLRNANILENNIVQTAASSGEAVAAGAIFTLPALILIGAWKDFDYWTTTLLAFVGGTLGVLFTIPLRRALVGDPSLPFPEGIATAELLKTGMATSTRGVQVSSLIWGAVAAGIAKFAEAGLRLWGDTLEGAAVVGRTIVYGGVTLSPALVAVGYIIGVRTAAVVCAGGLFGWWIILPIQSWLFSETSSVAVGQPGEAVAQAYALWSRTVRPIGIGAMLVGGLWTITQVRTALSDSLTRLIDRPRTGTAQSMVEAPSRLDRDLPPWALTALSVACLIGTVVAFDVVLNHPALALSLALCMVPAAFLFSSVAGYMAGLVGSSSNPVSGVTIAMLMLSASLLLLAFGADHSAGPVAALLIAAIVCCSAAMGGDNLQDLKTGQLVGATPWKQQVMQLIGVATGALVLPPVLNLLQIRYGIGPASELHPQSLSAPQAAMMANVAQAFFAGKLPWHLVGIGAGFAAVVIVMDRAIQRRKSTWRIPVLAVALGLYLPLKLSVAVFLGGLIAEVVNQRRASTASQFNSDSAGPVDHGLLAAAGLVTGEAIMGIVVAIPLALTMVRPDFTMPDLSSHTTNLAGPWAGGLMLIGIGLLLYWYGSGTGEQKRME
ncbi:MAG: oligopeptide transporter, OPT family [Nitrospiraceae bacterium]